MVSFTPESATKPAGMTNGHVSPPDKQPQGLLEDLVKAISNLSGDRSFKAVIKLVEENRALKTRIKKLEAELGEWKIAQWKTLEMVGKIMDEGSKAESGLRQRDKELKEAKSREMKARLELASLRELSQPLRKIDSRAVETMQVHTHPEVPAAP